MVRTLNIVGCGRVGQTLGRLLHGSGALVLQDLKGSDLKSAERAAAFMGAGKPAARLDDMRPADIWLLTVPDTQIGPVAAALAASPAARSCKPGRTPVAFHCSGCLSAEEMAALRTHEFGLASAHPVFSFADPAAAVGTFQSTPFGLEGDEAALQCLRPVLEAIGGACFTIRTTDKPLYHAAAVFSNNFTVVLQAIAREAWAVAGVPGELASTIQQALLRSTLDSVGRLGPHAITGPAARGDFEVVRAQGTEVFRWHPEAGALYQQLSRLAHRLATLKSTYDPDLAEYAGH